MSQLFQNLQKYAGKWEIVGEPQKLDAEDLNDLQPMAIIEKSTWGKSFRFTTKVGAYSMYIPADTSVEAPIGTRVPISEIYIVELHKEGEENIHRVIWEDKRNY